MEAGRPGRKRFVPFEGGSLGLGDAGISRSLLQRKALFLARFGQNRTERVGDQALLEKLHR